MTFSTWLRKQHKRNDAVGDLARDVRQDTNWPKKGSINAKREYLYDAHGLDEFDPAVSTLNRAWKEYKAARLAARS